MEQMPPVRRTGRRTSQRSAPTEPQNGRKRRKSRIGVVMALIVFVALVALIVLVSPKDPVSRATYTTGTADGHVGSAATGVSAAYQGLVISEMMPSNQTAVPDENGDYSDWVEVWNSTDVPISLKNVGLSDRNDSIRFLFPDVTLQPDERVVVFCSDTNAAEPGKPYHAKFKLSSVGETVYLFDPNAYLIDQATCPIMGGDESWALMDGAFTATTLYSPGYENTEAGHQAYITESMVADGALIINEIMADPITGLTDEEGELCDWIELYNTTDRTISLDNYALSNKENKPLKWRFPQGAVVAPHGYYVVFCSGKDRADSASSVPHTNFKISAEHDTIVLADNHGRLVDRVIVDNLPEDCSYARGGDGSFSVRNMATPGLPNDESGEAQMDYNLRALNKTGVYITEVMASNDSTLVYQDDGFTDWIEIYNSSQITVDLSGYGLSDNLGRGRKWQFPEGTYISPGEYKVILCDGKTELSTTAQLHTSFKLSRTEGETVCLATPEGRVIDKMNLPEMRTNVSYGRTIGLSGFFYYDSPTPMAANGTGFRGYTEAPSFVTAPGLYYTTVRTGFHVPEGTTVYYTTDGTIPTQSATPYHGETLELNGTSVVLRARAYADDGGLQPSEIITGSYFINTYHSMPIVSVSCDPDVLWNKETGLLVTGDNVVKEAAVLPFKNTVYRKYGKIGREGYVEMYLEDGTQLISQGTQFELAGDFSLDLPQKSMKFRAKSLYGEKTFQAQLFEDRPYTEYKSFVLRNCGNDGVWTRMVDGVQSRLMDLYGTQVIHQAWRPVAVYLNGIYWGHYNLRERVDRFFVAQHEGIPLDQAGEMDILRGDGSTEWGSNKAYKAMLAKIKEGNPATNEADRQYIEDNIDIDNHLEYMALEMFFGNSDIGNTRYYRLHQEGSKWKWIIYDLDYALFNTKFNSPYSYTKQKGMGQKNIDNTIFRKVLSVPEWREKFLQKLGNIFQTFTTEVMLAQIDQCLSEIEPEMKLHFARWAEEHDQMVISEWPTTIDGAYRYWERRVSRLRNVVRGRPHFLWEMVRDELKVSSEDMLKYFGPQPELPSEYIP